MRHKEYSDSRKGKLKEKNYDKEQDRNSSKYMHVILCLVPYWIRSRSSAYVLFQ